MAKIRKKIVALIIVLFSLIGVVVPVVMACFLYTMDGFVDDDRFTGKIMAYGLAGMGFFMIILIGYIGYRFTKRHGWYRFKRDVMERSLTDEEHEEFNEDV